MRLLDIIVSLVALICLSPLFLIVSIILRFSGEGEVLYLQERVGQHRQTFKIVKFATMLKDSANMGSGTITSKNDSRILPVGRILRKTKVNELPQLWNVLVGEMSLIGPRPHAARDLEGVPSEIQAVIMGMKPGLSGVGSIIFRNEEQILANFNEPREFYDNVIAPYKASLEEWYFVRRTIRLNVKLILLTLLVVIYEKPSLINTVLKGIPDPPDRLKKYINLRLGS